MPFLFEVESSDKLSKARVSTIEQTETACFEAHCTLKFGLAGIQQYRLLGNDYHLRQGQVLIIPPFTLFSRSFKPNEAVQELAISLSYSLFDKVVSRLGLEGNDKEIILLPGLLKAQGPLDTGQIMRELLEGAVPDELFSDVGQRLIRSQASRPLPQEGENPNLLLDRLRRVNMGKSYMQRCFTQPLRLQGIAAEACLSPFYFARQFRRFFKVSPIQYLNELRLGHALALLRQNQLGIAEIAGNTGFTDMPTFSKAFKRRFGVAPTRLPCQSIFTN